MKKLTAAFIVVSVFLAGCAAARPPVKPAEAIKNAQEQSMSLVDQFCRVKNFTGGEEKVKDLQDGIIWAQECEQKIENGTSEQNDKLEQFRETADEWMKQIKSGDRERLIKWTIENVPTVFGPKATTGENAK